MAVLGIDVGKFELHLCADALKVRCIQITFLSFGGRLASSDCTGGLQIGETSRVHSVHGIDRWLEQKNLRWICTEHGHVVSIVNPPAIKSFGQKQNPLGRRPTRRMQHSSRDRSNHAPCAMGAAQPAPGSACGGLGRRRVALDETRVQESESAWCARLERRAAVPRDDDLTLRGKLELLMWIPGIGERLAVTDSR